MNEENTFREGTIFEINKQYMSYFYLAINAAKNYGFNMEKSYSEFNKRYFDNRKCYEIRFFYKK